MDITERFLSAFKLAIDDEQRAHELYMSLAEMCDETELKNLFKKFAEDELQHKKMLMVDFTWYLWTYAVINKTFFNNFSAQNLGLTGITFSVTHHVINSSEGLNYESAYHFCDQSSCRPGGRGHCQPYIFRQPQSRICCGIGDHTGGIGLFCGIFAQAAAKIILTAETQRSQADCFCFPASQRKTK